MFTIRNMGGVALFLFGTTFLWLTPMFASEGVSTKGNAWSITLVLSLVVLVGFTVATWGLFTRAGWWDTLAVACATAGLVVLVPYWMAASNAGEVNPAFNVFIHAAGSAGVLVLLLVPALSSWVEGHVMSGG